MYLAIAKRKYMYVVPILDYQLVLLPFSIIANLVSELNVLSDIMTSKCIFSVDGKRMLVSISNSKLVQSTYCLNFELTKVAINWI